jgi:hypothetical protein
MPIDYVVHKDRRLVIITASGRLSAKDIEGRIAQAMVDSDFNPDYDEISDLRAVTSIDMSMPQTRTLARRKIYSPKSRRAIVASDPAIFGMGRLWGAHAELAQDVQIQVFYDLSAALKWLGIPEDSGLF